MTAKIENKSQKQLLKLLDNAQKKQEKIKQKELIIQVIEISTREDAY